MKKTLRRIFGPGFLAALFCFAGCAGHKEIGQAPVPAPTAGKASAPARSAPTAVPKNAKPLFVIERNTNANIVRYDANLAADGKLSPAEPITACWVMLAGDGSRKNLNWLERRKAYGVRIKPGPASGGYEFTLAAAPWLPLLVKQARDAGARVEKDINGRPAVLEKIFIQARGGLLGPKLVYIELYGKDLRSGEELREKIAPK